MKIVLTDPHPEFRQALRTMLKATSHELVGESADGVEALRLVEKETVDVLVLDINTPLVNGFEAAREIGRRGLLTQVVMLAIFKDDTSVLESFRSGAKAFVNKAQVATDLAPALHALESGKYYLSPGVTELVVKSGRPRGRSAISELTPTEMELLQWVVQDRPVADIAKQLNLSLQLLESHRTALMQKLQVSGIGGLVRHAVRRGALR